MPEMKATNRVPRTGRTSTNNSFCSVQGAMSSGSLPSVFDWPSGPWEKNHDAVREPEFATTRRYGRPQGSVTSSTMPSTCDSRRISCIALLCRVPSGISQYITRDPDETHRITEITKSNFLIIRQSNADGDRFCHSGKVAGASRGRTWKRRLAASWEGTRDA